MAEYRQNANWNEADESKEPDTNHGNTRLPFGLCKRYGILLPDNATPRDAWDALKGKGITPQKIYSDLRKNKKSNSNNKQTFDTSQLNAKKEADIETMTNDPRVIYSKRFTKEMLSENLQSATEEMRDLTVSLFNGDSFGYNSNERGESAYYSGDNKVCMKESNIGGTEDSPYSKGGVFFHETWHAIDDNYGTVSKLSTDYKLSNGQTFRQTFIDESRDADWQSIKAEIEHDQNEYYAKRGFDRKQIIADYDKMFQRAKQIQAETQENTGSWYDGHNEKRKFLQLDENVKLQENYKAVTSYPKLLQQKWGDVSDFYSAYMRDGSSLVNMGHTKSYWRKDSENRSIEAFAECASAKATNPESYALIHKYFPKTMQGFEEIFDQLKQGRIKSKGRPKYAK